METNSHGPSRDEALHALAGPSADRARLAEGIRVPWSLLAGFGAVAAWWVGAAGGTAPGEDYDRPAVGGLALAVALVIIHLIQRETGVRFASMGWQAGMTVTGVVAGCLVLFSVSLGLVAFGLHWAVIATSVLAFGLTTWLTGVAYRSAARDLRHA